MTGKKIQALSSRIPPVWAATVASDLYNLTLACGTNSTSLKRFLAINHSAYLSNFIKLYKLFHRTPRRNILISARTPQKTNFEELPRSSCRYFGR
jgi:hypothetical protein